MINLLNKGLYSSIQLLFDKIVVQGVLGVVFLLESDSACIVILISFYGLRTRLPVSNFICLVCDVRTVGTESKFG